MTVDRLLTGKRSELFVFDELLKRGFIPYVPLVDSEGIDAIIRTPDGYHLEIQVKQAQTEKNPRWFQLLHLKASPVLFLICIEPDNTTWVIPSLVFKKYCTQAKEVYDLDLDLRPRDRDTIRKELLAPYKNNWDLLTRTIEDLGDLMAMYESLAAPEEESMTLAEYEALRRKRV